MTETELERIRSAYQARDAASETPYRWDNPGYVAYMQSVERAVLRALGDVGVPLKDARVLDVGCGSGYFLHRLHEYGAAECHGIDLMENRIADGRERYPTLELVAGTATELPYAEGQFDLVTQFTCLSSILDDDVRLAVAREMQRVANGGWLFSFDMRGLWLSRLARRRPKCVDSTQTVALDRPEPDPSVRRAGGAAQRSTDLRTCGGDGESSGGRNDARRFAFFAHHLLGVWQVLDGKSVAAGANANRGDRDAIG